MKILSVESSTVAASCCVTENGFILSRSSVNAGLTHSRTLMSLITHSLHDADLSMDDIEAIAIAAGPGSFTGVRIGVSAVKGLAFPKNLPCISVSTLEGIAYLAKGLPFDGIICPLMDARCKQVYTALFSMKDGFITRIGDDEAVSMDSVFEKLRQQNQPILLIGDGAAMCYNEWKDNLTGLHLAPISFLYPDAVGVAAVAEQKMLAGETVSAESLLPVYLRLPQAERELKAKQQNG